jgi:hypothetical protein
MDHNVIITLIAETSVTSLSIMALLLNHRCFAAINKTACSCRVVLKHHVYVD